MLIDTILHLNKRGCIPIECKTVIKRIETIHIQLFDADKEIAVPGKYRLICGMKCEAGAAIINSKTIDIEQDSFQNTYRQLLSVCNALNLL